MFAVPLATTHCSRTPVFRPPPTGPSPVRVVRSPLPWLWRPRPTEPTSIPAVGCRSNPNTDVTVTHLNPSEATASRGQ